MAGDIPWVVPSLDYFEDKSVTQQSLGSQSSSSDNSSSFYDDFSMTQPSSLEIRPSDYLPLSDWQYEEQSPSGDFFGVDSYLGDPLDTVPFDNSLTAVTVPQTAPDSSPVYFELQDLSESARQPDIQSSIPSPMAQTPVPFYEQYWRGDNFPEIEISEGEQELADVSSLESNSSLPTITTMFSTTTISTPSKSSVCKIECPGSSTFPVGYVKKEKPHSTRQRQGKQVALWQFLFHALEHPKQFDTMIVWVDKSKGIFEFSSKNKDCLARAWGAVKNNRCPMTYPKLARALRKYIEGDKFITKRKRKLQYVFRPEFLNDLRSGAIIRPLSSADQEKIYQFSRAGR